MSLLLLRFSLVSFVSWPISGGSAVRWLDWRSSFGFSKLLTSVDRVAIQTIRRGIQGRRYM